MTPRVSAACASATACLFLIVAGCGTDADDQPKQPPSPSVVMSNTNPGSATTQWKRLDGYTQNLVCLQALERGGPDYRGMLHELMKAGLPQPEAAAVLPYAANECM